MTFCSAKLTTKLTKSTHQAIKNSLNEILDYSFAAGAEDAKKADWLVVLDATAKTYPKIAYVGLSMGSLLPSSKRLEQSAIRTHA